MNAPIIERLGRIAVLRDDLLEGGSKMRFLPFIAGKKVELVFGGPYCGGAPLALSVLGKQQKRPVTLFYAKRKEKHRRQIQAKANGAKIVEVDPGYMTNVQAKARVYSQKKGALFLPLGFDVPEARDPFVAAMRDVRKKLGGSPDEVWCCAGSGMLARCLGEAFPESHVMAVAVGLRSRHQAQAFPPNVSLIEHSLQFHQESRFPSPFPSCPNYDLKAFEICSQRSKGSVLFWNVLGE